MTNFKVGDVVRQYWWSLPSQPRYFYVENVSIITSDKVNLNYVTYYGERVEMIEINGCVFSASEFTLITSILREEE